jgi:hypothetical protein
VTLETAASLQKLVSLQTAATADIPRTIKKVQIVQYNSDTISCVCLIGKQKKPILFKVTEPSSNPACAKMAAYPDPPPVLPVPDTGVAQVTPSPGRGLLEEQECRVSRQLVGRLGGDEFCTVWNLAR